MPLLAPWLIVQGKRVHRSTLRLPEAEGEKRGSCGTGTGFNLLLIGDSAAAGVGCKTQDEALAGQLAGLLSKHHQVNWQLVAQSSRTCAGVLDMVRNTELSLPSIDAVVISVGVNDVTKRTSYRQWQRDLNELTGYLRDKLGTAQIIYTGLPPMHHFPALPQPLRWFIGQQARQLDKLLARHCLTNENVHYLKLDLPFSAKYMARDGFHPNPTAAKIWAQRAADIIRS
ncbi:MAG: SGNH/GDSL hydrolase family protein [Pseudomonadota bacterium]